MMGNGAILSTARDLTKYARAMLHPESTPFPSAIKRVETLQYGSIAYNWFVTAGGNLWHNGQTGGYSALMKLYLKTDVAVFSLSDVSLEVRCLIEAVDQLPCDPNLR
jgi:CubicO group peptidase (beta-lactamase class C family)